MLLSNFAHRRQQRESDCLVACADMALNHLGIHVGSKEDVDKFQAEFMQPRGIKAEFETPRPRPDFGGDYYQVMFIDPEGLAIEVFHA